MSMSAAFTTGYSLGGKRFDGQATITGETALVSENSVPAAKSGQLTTRTDADTGTLTMSGGHGITTGAIVSIFWAGGARYDVTVGTVAGNSVPFDTGSGDDLPDNLTSVTVMVAEQFDLAFAGDDLAALVFYSESIGILEFMDGATVLQAYITAGAGQVLGWNDTLGVLHGLEGDDVTHVRVSHGQTSAKTMRVGALLT